MADLIYLDSYRAKRKRHQREDHFRSISERRHPSNWGNVDDVDDLVMACFSCGAEFRFGDRDEHDCQDPMR